MSVVPRSFEGGSGVPSTRVGDDETAQLQQWWKRLSPEARTAFLTGPEVPIPARFLDEVMAGGIRIVGSQRGDSTMVWSFPASTRMFIAEQRRVPGGADVHPAGSS